MSLYKYQKIEWADYLQLDRVQTNQHQILHSIGIDWTSSPSSSSEVGLTGKGIDYLQAKQVQDRAFVIVPDFDHPIVGVEEEKEKDRFYLELANLDLSPALIQYAPDEAVFKAADFMMEWGIDHVETHRIDQPTMSNVFTIQDLNSYQQDFLQCFYYFGAARDFLFAKDFQDQVKESIGLDLMEQEKIKKETGKAGRRSFWAEHGGPLDLMERLNKHSGRCKNQIDIETTETGVPFYKMTMSFPDQIARAYHQLASLITSDEKQEIRFRKCSFCKDILKVHNKGQMYCSLMIKKCSKQAELRRYYLKSMEDPERKAKKRQQSRDSKKK